ncbi:hypothetical protein GCM10008995_22690 [Halobellus salinus]|uniref:Uncharacterized protein n=1 Tax=Halobellus salinus TaxID=931585 RepID=A0A830EI02_9EURY|nr:hypothetical protein [Halobellus salinus]GGJ12275.1 hypothetical protein GCM10008995_22690 [Halobellus salinus]SMP29095.1 hypothetical protein SAMN06265347_11461 [Halobellus salinus]
MSGLDSAVDGDDAAAGDAAARVEEAETRAEDLRNARERLSAVESEIESIGEAAVVDAADAYRKAAQLLDRYEGSATGTGDFQAYVEFQDTFLGLVEDRDDTPASDAFSAAGERLDQRRLSESDFDGAREDLEPAAAYVDLLDRREDAAEAVAKAKRDARLCRRALDEEIDERAAWLAVGEADLDAPVAELTDPIEAYNDAVVEEFDEFYASASIAAVVDFLDRTEAFPLVEFRSPPRDLREFAAESPDADEPIPTLLEYADYTGSKLDHYAEDPGLLQTTVAVHRTYLERLSGEPLTVSLPPPPREELRFRARELVSLLGRFADEETVARVRTVRDLTRRDDYRTLRRATRAHQELDADELAAVQSGTAAAELERLRGARDRLVTALEGRGGDA